MLALIASIGLIAAASSGITIEVAHGSERERTTKRTLEQILVTYDLKSYTFTERVVIEEGAINHAFPVLTLNARFARSPDELLSSYVHEQIHWHLRDRPQLQAAIAELRRWYPSAPVGSPSASKTAPRAWPAVARTNGVAMVCASASSSSAARRAAPRSSQASRISTAAPSTRDRARRVVASCRTRQIAAAASSRLP